MHIIQEQYPIEGACRCLVQWSQRFVAKFGEPSYPRSRLPTRFSQGVRGDGIACAYPFEELSKEVEQSGSRVGRAVFVDGNMESRGVERD